MIDFQFPFPWVVSVFGISHKPPKRQLPEWSEGQTRESGLTDPQKKRHLEGGAISERDRIETPCKKEDYSFFNYLSYSLYSPLYLAGPIITFNDFIDQVRGKSILCILKEQKPMYS